MKDYDRIEKLILQRSYDDLSEEERDLIKELAEDAETFNKLKHSLHFKVDQIKVDPGTLNALRSKMALRKTKQTWGILKLIHYPVPGYVMIIILLLVVFAGQYFNTQSSIEANDEVVMSEPVLVMDTVYIYKKDTIRIETVKYIEKPPVLIAKVDNDVQKNQSTIPKSSAKMSEYEDLSELIVSGL